MAETEGRAKRKRSKEKIEKVQDKGKEFFRIWVERRSLKTIKRIPSMHRRKKAKRGQRKKGDRGEKARA